MICDALSEDEIYQAFLIYASLNGLSTDEADVRERISQYLKAPDDSAIDEAILAYVEDRMVAPPDIVLRHWGKSRVYELEPGQTSRHKVSEAWFESGCQFSAERLPKLCHFWTYTLQQSCQREIRAGDRLRFRLATSDDQSSHVMVLTICEEPLAKLEEKVAKEFIENQSMGLRYLPLVDSVRHCDDGGIIIKLMVTVAAAQATLDEIVEYAHNAFFALRNKC